MDSNILAHDWRTAQYADGVFIRLTGGTVHDFEPWPKVDGYLDAPYMAQSERNYWLYYCVAVLGYVVPSEVVRHVQH